MDYPQREKLLLVLAKIITDGDLINADLTCPVCGRFKINFSFTRIPHLQKFGLFIECQNCMYRHHYTFIAKPKNFKNELVLEQYQLLEDQVTEETIKNKRER